MDKVANTVGHYDAFSKDLDMLQPVKLLIPSIDHLNNKNNEIYKEDANALIRKISCDVLYIDPPTIHAIFRRLPSYGKFNRMEKTRSCRDSKKKNGSLPY